MSKEIHKNIVVIEGFKFNVIYVRERQIKLNFPCIGYKENDKIIINNEAYDPNVLIYKEKFLELILTKKWFDLIKSGEKTIEYRDITEFWWKRIFTSSFPLTKPTFGSFNGKHKYVRFKLGYSYDQIMVFKLGHIQIDNAKPEWSNDNMEKMICINLQKKLY